MGLNYTKGNEPVSMKGFDKLPWCLAATDSFASSFLVCLCRRQHKRLFQKLPKTRLSYNEMLDVIVLGQLGSFCAYVTAC